MNRHNNTKGKTLQYGQIVEGRLILGLTREEYSAAKVAGNRDTFKGYDKGGIWHQAQCHGYMLWQNKGSDVIEAITDKEWRNNNARRMMEKKV